MSLLQAKLSPSFSQLKLQLADLLTGQCLLVLLNGESGTGKTLMAECCKFPL